MADFSKDELRDLIKETVHATLEGLGVDVENPIEVQHDLSALREWRVAMVAVKKKAAVVAVGTVVAAALAVLWIGLKSFVLSD